ATAKPRRSNCLVLFIVFSLISVLVDVITTEIQHEYLYHSCVLRWLPSNAVGRYHAYLFAMHVTDRQYSRHADLQVLETPHQHPNYQDHGTSCMERYNGPSHLP